LRSAFQIKRGALEGRGKKKREKNILSIKKGRSLPLLVKGERLEGKKGEKCGLFTGKKEGSSAQPKKRGR